MHVCGGKHGNLESFRPNTFKTVSLFFCSTIVALSPISLSEGGTPAKFLIIDDGWQDVTNEFQKEGEPYVDGSQ